MGTTLAIPELRTRKTIRFDYYAITDVNGGSAAFSAALTTVEATHVAQRSRDVRHEPVTIYHLHHNGHRFEGDIGRLRMTDTPFIGSRAGRLSEIVLSHDQGLAECSAFLFDEQTRILAIQSKKEAVSASRLIGYVTRFAPNDDETFPGGHPGFDYEIAINSDTERKLQSIRDFRVIDVKYTDFAATRLDQPDQSTREFVRGGRVVGGESIEIRISAGRRKRNILNFQAVTNLISGARRNHADRLVVSGRSAADESLTLDLISDRIQDFVAIDARGRTASYEQRRMLLREAYQGHVEAFIRARQ